MHDILDDYAHSNALRETSPRLKLLLGLGCILISVSSTTPVAPLFVALTLSLATLILARIPGRIYSRLLLVPLSFALISAAVVAFMHGAGQTLYSMQLFGTTFSLQEGGAELAILLISRTFGGMCSLFFIALTTPMIEMRRIASSAPPSCKEKVVPKSCIE
ncbi:MAG: cobalt/nickel transport system permease protein [Euryarchaeota archaeon]|nr:cobalt/nickel transport system permease protein [Euryarchaeota archaeon]